MLQIAEKYTIIILALVNNIKSEDNIAIQISSNFQ